MNGRGAFLLLAALYPTAAAWVYFVVLAGRPGMSVAYFAAKVLQAALPLVGWYLLGVERPRWRRQRRLGLGAGLLAGLLMGAPIVALFALLRGSTLLAAVPASVLTRLRPFGADSPLGYLALALGLAIVHSLFEEYYWRWFLFGALERRLALAPALTLASLAFAAHHVIVVERLLGPGWLLAAVLPAALGVAVAGAVWALLWRRSSLLSPWLGHVVVDLVVLGLGYRLVWP